MTASNRPIPDMAIVIPVFEESDTIKELLSRIEQSFDCSVLFVIVDDGSKDNTIVEILSYKLRPNNSRIIVQLSRNFGHQAALYAGLEFVPSDLDKIVVMDGDLQDLPEDVPKLIEPLARGFDCVYAVRRPRSSNAIIDLATGLFYKIQTALSSFPIPRFAGTFCAFNKVFLDSLLAFREVDVYFPGIRAYIGMKQAEVHVDRGFRKHGTSKVGVLGLMRLSITGLFGFSAAPMRMILLSGMTITLISVFVAVGLIVLFFANIIKSLTLSLLFLFACLLLGVHMMFLGVVGEYIGKLFVESKRRPRTIVARVIND